MARLGRISNKRAVLVLCTLGFLGTSSTLALAEKFYSVSIACCAKGDPCKFFRISCAVGTSWAVCAAAACGYKSKGGVKLFNQGK